MSSALFDKIHGDAYLSKRTEPATIEEFVEFGLQPEDYVRYVGLQQKLQSELLLYGFLRSHTESDQEGWAKALEELITFCQNKRLIACPDDAPSTSFYSVRAAEFRNIKLYRWDAEYYHDWLRYPKDPAEFRLSVERKLTLDWDEEDAYITETYGVISFSYDDYTEASDGAHWVESDSPVRIKRYDPDAKKSVTLKNAEVKKLFDIAQKEKHKIEKEIAEHLSQLPAEHDVAAVSVGLSWVKKMYALRDRQEIIESVFDDMSRAVSTPDIYKFKDSDVLFVFCGIDTCAEANHLLSNIKVDFSFYGKPDKQYTIKRCSHCKQFRISLQDLIAMFDSYGVPRGIIIYDDDASGDFSDFAETSILYDMGYTVSQSADLTAAKRQSILKYAIETGKASKYQVLNFLKQRMNINGMKSGNEIAFRKWKEDYEFVRQL